MQSVDRNPGRPALRPEAVAAGVRRIGSAVRPVRRIVGVVVRRARRLRHRQGVRPWPGRTPDRMAVVVAAEPQPDRHASTGRPFPRNRRGSPHAGRYAERTLPTLRRRRLRHRRCPGDAPQSAARAGGSRRMPGTGRRAAAPPASEGRRREENGLRCEHARSSRLWNTPVGNFGQSAQSGGHAKTADGIPPMRISEGLARLPCMKLQQCGPYSPDQRKPPFTGIMISFARPGRPLHCACCGRAFSRPSSRGPAPLYCSEDCRKQMRVRARVWNEGRSAPRTPRAPNGLKRTG